AGTRRARTRWTGCCAARSSSTCTAWCGKGCARPSRATRSSGSSRSTASPAAWTCAARPARSRASRRGSSWAAPGRPTTSCSRPSCATTRMTARRRSRCATGSSRCATTSSAAPACPSRAPRRRIPSPRRSWPSSAPRSRRWSRGSRRTCPRMPRSARRSSMRWLLAQMLEFHRREDKSTWWEYFSRLELSPEELIEDGATLGGLEYEGVVDEVQRSLIHRYRFPPQDHAIREGMRPHDPATKAAAGEVWAVDDVRGFIDLKRGRRSEAPHPTALVPLEHVNAGVLQDSLRRIAEAVAEHGFGDALPYRCAADLLLALPPD